MSLVKLYLRTEVVIRHIGLVYSFPSYDGQADFESAQLFHLT